MFAFFATLPSMLNHQYLQVKEKRDVIKKVIAYMTLGIDVSKLYMDMIKVYF